jgi:hypothetical protein
MAKQPARRAMTDGSGTSVIVVKVSSAAKLVPLPNTKSSGVVSSEIFPPKLNVPPWSAFKAASAVLFRGVSTVESS